MTAAVACAVFTLAYRSGGYSFLDRGAFASVLWWSIVVVIGLGLIPAGWPSRAVVTVGGLLAAYAAWILASAAWAPSGEDVLGEFNRATLYLAVFAVAALGARGNAVRWADGIAIAIVAIATVALVSRLFPGTFSLRGLPAFLPASRARLSFPVDYWNGLAILAALAVPLLLRAAVAARCAARRGIALAPLPALAAVVFLSSSRGGVAVAVTGAAVFVALTERRWNAVAAVAVAVVGSASAVWILLGRAELVNGPLGTQAAVEQGRGAAALLALVTIVTALSWAAATMLARDRIRVPRPVGYTAFASVLAAVILGLAAVQPVQLFETFKRHPDDATIASEDFARAHLLSGGGSGRWQFWTAAVDQFRERPLHGWGAGTYEAWWAEHGTLSYFARDAHSLYLEVLGELGVVGLTLLLGAFVGGAAVGLARVRAAQGDERVLRASLLATSSAFLLALAIDWIWELAALSAVGFCCLGLLTGSAAGERKPPRSSESRFTLGIAAVAAGWILALLHLLPLLAELELRQSQAAARSGDLAAADSQAGNARTLTPWAAAPYVQLALIAELEGHLPRARARLAMAIERDEQNWRLWLIASRLEAKDGAIAAARRSLDRAADLNPRSPLFAEP